MGTRNTLYLPVCTKKRVTLNNCDWFNWSVSWSCYRPLCLTPTLKNFVQVCGFKWPPTHRKVFFTQMRSFDFDKLTAFLSVCMFACLFACLSVCMSACMPAGLSAFLPALSAFINACLAVCMLAGLSAHLPALSAFLAALSVCLFVCLRICLLICLPCLFFCQLVSLCFYVGSSACSSVPSLLENMTVLFLWVHWICYFVWFDLSPSMLTRSVSLTGSCLLLDYELFLPVPPT